MRWRCGLTRIRRQNRRSIIRQRRIIPAPSPNPLFRKQASWVIAPVVPVMRRRRRNRPSSQSFLSRCASSTIACPLRPPLTGPRATPIGPAGRRGRRKTDPFPPLTDYTQMTVAQTIPVSRRECVAQFSRANPRLRIQIRSGSDSGKNDRRDNLQLGLGGSPGPRDNVTGSARTYGNAASSKPVEPRNGANHTRESQG